MKLTVMCISVLLCSAGLWGQEFRLGGKVTDFEVQTTSGGAAQFSKLSGETTVVMFIATKCPVSNAYNERMKALYNDYAPKGVKFIFVNSNGSEPAAEVVQHAKEKGFPFAVYKDEGNVVADRFGAQVTPEAFVMGRDGTVLYHGSVDDAQNAERVQVQGLRNALDAVLGGKAVAQGETKAFGCSIKRTKKTT